MSVPIRVMTIIGARPQFIKAAVVSRLCGTMEGVEEVILHTGQHYDANMASIFFDELSIPQPNYNLGIGSGPHGQQTGRMLEKIEAAIQEVQPDWVLVYGDTNSTLAGALAASKLHVKVAHVEAGLRSFNRYMPEEINRILTDHAADILLAPTMTAVSNLHAEGIAEARIFQVGDVMYDAALFYGGEAERCSRVLDRLGLEIGEFVLATVHRAENTDDAGRLSVVMGALERVAKEIKVVLPLHPRTREALKSQNIVLPKSVIMTDPVGYLDMVMLERHAAVVVTDSGGVQKEAFFHKTPCVTLRDETEWLELLESGWNVLAPPVDVASVAESIMDSIGRSGTDVMPYGEGNAGRLILETLQKS